MGQYSIKEIEQLSGIKAHTIRIWEQRYKLIEPRRTQTNIRYYDDQQLKYLLNVSLLSKNGHKISQISRWSTKEFSEQVRHLYEQTLLHDESLHLELGANDLVTAMIDMDELKFVRIYVNSIRKVGFERTITELIYPFLEKVGILWSIDQINPAHEHYISSIIRQKIIAAIDGLPINENGKKFLLFLPEGEHHEIGLLLANFLVKKNGGRVYYLGQNLPTNDYESAVDALKPDYSLTFLVDPALINNAESVVGRLIQNTKHGELLIAMRASEEIEKIGGKKLHFLHSINDLAKFYS